MILWNPELYNHIDDQMGALVVLGKDNYCGNGQVVAQPVKKVFWKIYITYGKSMRSWLDCFEEVK